MNVLTIWASPLFEIAQSRDSGVIGYLVIKSRFVATADQTLTGEQLAGLQAALKLAKSLIQRLLAPERIRVIQIGTQKERHTVLVIPVVDPALPPAANEPDYFGVSAAKDAIERLAFVARARLLVAELHLASAAEKRPTRLTPGGLANLNSGDGATNLANLAKWPAP